MIFKNSISEIYWILSILLPRYDIKIFKNIIKEKNKLEKNETINWYINLGIKLNKIRKNNNQIERLLFIPYNDNYVNLKNIPIKIFHTKILIETFSLECFITNNVNNEYINGSIKDYIKTLKYFVRKYGICDIQNKIFVYKTHKLTDLRGNKCIRSIIINHDNSYDYKTIALINNKYKDPIDRIIR